MTENYVRTLERLAQHCESVGHDLCAETGECETALRSAQSANALQMKAARFDAGGERLSLRARQPTAQWTTTALLRTAKDLLLTPPTNAPLWRSISITTALARLGERGIGADAVVRTAFARDLVRRIVGDAAAFWCAGEIDDVADVAVPEILQPWVRLLEADPSLEQHRTELPAHVASVALAGHVGNAASRWIRTAAVAHIVGWRVDDYLVVDRQPSDCVLLGGKDVTIWVAERFTRTYVPEWRPSSLQWEQMYLADAEAVSRASGVALSILRERVVTSQMLTDALRAKLIGRIDEDFEQRELGDSSIASLARMLDTGQIEAALLLSQRFHEAHPQAVHFAMAYAFCLVAKDPARARAQLTGLHVQGDHPNAVRTINVATCALLMGDVRMAQEDLAKITAGDLSTAWLWSPASVAEGEPKVVYSSVSAWMEEFHQLYTPTSQRTAEELSSGA